MSVTKRLIAFLLAFVVFISSGGVVMAVHYCSMKSSKEISIFNQKSCCTDKAKTCENNRATELRNKKCCDLTVTYHKIDISTIFSVIEHVDLQVPAFDYFSFNLNPAKTSFFDNILSNKAPPYFSGGKHF